MKIVKIEDEKITFDNGIKLVSYHKQDCCEHVYADFNQLKDQDIFDKEFSNDIEIEKIANTGFRLISKDKTGYFVPCYNNQNGYYSSQLDLLIRQPKKKDTIIAISDCVKDNID